MYVLPYVLYHLFWFPFHSDCDVVEVRNLHFNRHVEGVYRRSTSADDRCSNRDSFRRETDGRTWFLYYLRDEEFVDGWRIGRDLCESNVG